MIDSSKVSCKTFSGQYEQLKKEVRNRQKTKGTQIGNRHSEERHPTVRLKIRRAETCGINNNRKRVPIPNT